MAGVAVLGVLGEIAGAAGADAPIEGELTAQAGMHLAGQRAGVRFSATYGQGGCAGSWAVSEDSRRDFDGESLLIALFGRKLTDSGVFTFMAAGVQ